MRRHGLSFFGDNACQFVRLDPRFKASKKLKSLQAAVNYFGGQYVVVGCRADTLAGWSEKRTAVGRTDFLTFDPGSADIQRTLSNHEHPGVNSVRPLFPIGVNSAPRTADREDLAEDSAE